MSASTIFYSIMTVFVIFLALEKVWGWSKKLTAKPSKPAPPPPPPERTLTQKDLEDILDLFIEYQGSVVTDTQPPRLVIQQEPAPNGHRDVEEDTAAYFARRQSDEPEKEDAMQIVTTNTRQALAEAGLLVAEPEPKPEAKAKKKGKKS